MERAAEALDLPRDELLQAAIEVAAACADGRLLALFAAARGHQHAQRALAPDALRWLTRTPPLRPSILAWSSRGARPLFERLVALGALRELTGRGTFRRYGL